MKFDVNILRYIEKDAWRVLVSVEMGMKNHELVPVELVNAISGLKHGGAFKLIRELLKHKLVHHENQKYDGYRLTPLGYDFLAIKAFVNRGANVGVGRRIGVGKESDVFEVVTEEAGRSSADLWLLNSCTVNNACALPCCAPENTAAASSSRSTGMKRWR